MRKKEYAIWGTKNGKEDIIRVNGQEVQNTLLKAKTIENILRKRGEFSNVRIQTIKKDNWDAKTSFIGAIKRKR